MQPVTQNLRHPTPSPEAPAEQNTRLVSQRARTVIASILSGALALGVAYVVGRAEGAAKSAAIEQRAQQQKAGLARNTDELRKRLADHQRRIRLLEARRSLHRSLMALELDNFGTAREQLAKAHKLLTTPPPPPGSPLSDLGETMVGVELGVTADPLPQRLELTRLAGDLDEILGG